MLSCEDAPVMCWGEGEEEWYLNNKRHRWNGPALISKKKGLNVWILFGKRVAQKNYLKWLKNSGIDINNITVEDKLLIQMKYGS